MGLRNRNAELFYPEWKKPSWTQYQRFSSKAVTVICDVLSRWNWNQVYFIQDICEIKNIMLLFYLCDIVRKDVIWLLKPLALYLKAKADNSNKSLSLSLWFVIWTTVSCHGNSMHWGTWWWGWAGCWGIWPATASHLTLCFWTRFNFLEFGEVVFWGVFCGFFFPILMP